MVRRRIRRSCSILRPPLELCCVEDIDSGLLAADVDRERVSSGLGVSEARVAKRHDGTHMRSSLTKPPTTTICEPIRVHVCAARPVGCEGRSPPTYVQVNEGIDRM